MMLKEHIVETYGPIRYTIGAGLLGRLDPAAHGRGRLPRPARRHPAQLQLPRHLDDRARRRRLPPADALLRGQPGFTAVGAPRWRAAHRDPSDCALWDATFCERGRRRPARPTATCRRADQVYDPATNPPACAARSRTTRSIWGLQERVGPVEKKIGDGFANAARPTTSACSTACGRCSRARSRRSSSSTSTPRVGGLDIDSTPARARRGRRPGHGARSPTAPARSPTRASSATCRSSTCAATARAARSTRFHSYVMRARLDKANGGHGNQIIWTWPAAGRSSASRRTPDDRDEVVPADRPLAGARSRPTSGTSRCAQKVRARQAGRRGRRVLHRRATRRRDRTDAGRRARPLYPHYGDTRIGGRRAADRRRHPVPAASRSTRADYPVDVHRRPVGAAAAGVPGRRLRLQQAGRRPAARRCRG